MKYVVIITGGSRGIGKVLAGRFIKKGASVVICSRNKAELDQTQHELDPSGTQLSPVVTDVSVYKDCQKLITKVFNRYKKIDILINNAGIYGPIGLLEQTDVEKWKETVSVNLLGTMHCCHSIIPLFKKQKYGKIINMSGGGIGGKRPLSHFSSYYTSKGAIVAFTEVLAHELKDSNIQVNCISPGEVNTFLTDTVIKSGIKTAGKYMYEKSIKQKETGGDSPELTADLVEFLTSEKAQHITGKILSAKWDNHEMLKKKKHITDNLFTLRRIDNELFYEK